MGEPFLPWYTLCLIRRHQQQYPTPSTDVSPHWVRHRFSVMRGDCGEEVELNETRKSTERVLRPQRLQFCCFLARFPISDTLLLTLLVSPPSFRFRKGLCVAFAAKVPLDPTDNAVAVLHQDFCSSCVELPTAYTSQASKLPGSISKGSLTAAALFCARSLTITCRMPYQS